MILFLLPKNNPPTPDQLDAVFTPIADSLRCKEADSNPHYTTTTDEWEALTEERGGVAPTFVDFIVEMSKRPWKFALAVAEKDGPLVTGKATYQLAQELSVRGCRTYVVALVNGNLLKRVANPQEVNPRDWKAGYTL